MQDLLNLIRWMFLRLCRSGALPQAEVLTLRHHLDVLRRTSPRRPVFSSFDRIISVSACIGSRRAFWTSSRCVEAIRSILPLPILGGLYHRYVRICFPTAASAGHASHASD